MYSVDEIREVTFKKAGRGYNADDVDVFVDQIAAEYELVLREVTALRAENQKLKEEVKNASGSQSSLQNILVSAQRFADQIVEEAKQKAEEILTEAKKSALETSQQIEADKESCKANILQANESAQREIEKLLKDGVKRSEAMKTAAKDSVERQQLLFDKLKTEIVSFKSQIMDMYKEHLSLFSQIPDEVPFDAVRAAAAVNAVIDAQPDFEDMVQNKEDPSMQETAEEEQTEAEQPSEENAAQSNEEMGFTRIMDIPLPEESEE